MNKGKTIIGANLKAMSVVTHYNIVKQRYKKCIVKTELIPPRNSAFLLKKWRVGKNTV